MDYDMSNKSLLSKITDAIFESKIEQLKTRRKFNLVKNASGRASKVKYSDLNRLAKLEITGSNPKEVRLAKEWRDILIENIKMFLDDNYTLPSYYEEMVFDKDNNTAKYWIKMELHI